MSQKKNSYIQLLETNRYDAAYSPFFNAYVILDHFGCTLPILAADMEDMQEYYQWCLDEGMNIRFSDLLNDYLKEFSYLYICYN